MEIKIQALIKIDTIFSHSTNTTGGWGMVKRCVAVHKNAKQSWSIDGSNGHTFIPFDDKYLY
jgi:hypothetical protein